MLFYICLSLAGLNPWAQLGSAARVGNSTVIHNYNIFSFPQVRISTHMVHELGSYHGQMASSAHTDFYTRLLDALDSRRTFFFPQDHKFCHRLTILPKVRSFSVHTKRTTDASNTRTRKPHVSCVITTLSFSYSHTLFESTSHLTLVEGVLVRAQSQIRQR